MLPGDDAPSEYFKMHWSAKLMNRQKWDYCKEIGAPHQEVKLERCMDCGRKIEPDAVTGVKRNFYFFRNGSVFCQECVHRYAMANIKIVKWRDFKGEHCKVFVSWLELSTFNSLTYMDDEGGLVEVRLDPHIELKILIYVFYWDESVRGWSDFEHNERMPKRYENRMWDWIKSEAEEMGRLNRDTVRSKGLDGAVRHQRYMGKINPLEPGAEMDARKAVTKVVPKKLTPAR